MINFKGQVVLPLDLNMVYFRLIVANEHGDAAMVEVSAADFWELVVELGPSVVGHTGACIVNIKEGQLLTCPIDYRDVRSGRPGRNPFMVVLLREALGLSQFGSQGIVPGQALCPSSSVLQYQLNVVCVFSVVSM